MIERRAAAVGAPLKVARPLGFRSLGRGGIEVDLVKTQDIFTFKREGADDNGAGKGRFLATGFVPRFYEDLQQRGLSPNMGIFREDG